jgi:hypothetical protein
MEIDIRKKASIISILFADNLGTVHATHLIMDHGDVSFRDEGGEETSLINGSDIDDAIKALQEAKKHLK